MYGGNGASSDDSFQEQIHLWYQERGLPGEVRGQMQTLRVWRNASLHKDEQRWRADGPCGAAEASLLITALANAVTTLTELRGAASSGDR